MWKRYKDVTVPWSVYDRHYEESYSRVVNLSREFSMLDRPVQGREFPLSKMVVILLLKVMLGVSYRNMASIVRGFGLDRLLGLKRPPSYKTIQRTMEHLPLPVLERVNKQLVPGVVPLAGVDASGLRTTRKGGWVVIRFGHKQRKREYKKIHILVDLHTKKILYSTLTNGTSADHPQLPRLLKGADWVKYKVVLGDSGYDTKECFNVITEHNATPGIPVRKNASPRAHGSPSRRKAVLEQQKDKQKWKQKVQYTMRAIVEAIFSATKRRIGETLSSIRDDHREKEIWLRTIIWNTTIYPR